MKKLSKRLRILLLVWVPSLVLAGLADLLVLSPQGRQMRNLETRLQEQKRICELAQAAANPQTQARLTKLVDGLNQRVARFAVPWEGTENLAMGIVQVANQVGLGSFSMRPRGRQEFEPAPHCDCLGEKQIDVTFAASFPAFATFLNAMERYRPMLFIENFTILRGQLQSGQPQINMQLVLFVEKPQEGKASLERKGS
jgi:hypothetical protein